MHTLIFFGMGALAVLAFMVVVGTLSALGEVIHQFKEFIDEHK